jgi:hypothetical protein
MTATVGRHGSTMTAEALRRLEESLWRKAGAHDVWMIVDAARDERIYPLLLDCFYSRHSCLLSGALTPELVIVAPYLIQLEQDDARTRRFLSQAWGNSWGIFLECGLRAETLRRHLRGLLIVRDRRNNEMMFRYYDPRVMRVYLPTCNSGELGTVFGPIQRMWVEDETPDTILEFAVDASRLVRTPRSLGRPEGDEPRRR